MDMIYKLMDELDVSLELMCEELKKINKKADLTPQEVESIKAINCVIKDYLINCAMLEESEGEDWDEYSEMGSSRASRRSSGGYSNARGRSPRTGRYISRGNSYANNGGGNSSRRMSNESMHSIKDRMVARLESMMDEAGSDYERSEVESWINEIRNSERSSRQQ